MLVPQRISVSDIVAVYFSDPDALRSARAGVSIVCDSHLPPFSLDAELFGGERV